MKTLGGSHQITTFFGDLPPIYRESGSKKVIKTLDKSTYRHCESELSTYRCNNVCNVCR